MANQGDRKKKRRAAASAFNAEVGARLRAKRIAANLTQEEAGAQAGGLSGPQVSRLESGENSADPATIAAFASLYGCKPSDLIDGIAVKSA